MNTFYEFFAGGGMARAGLGQGWHCLFANDISEQKAAAYRANWGDGDLHVRDVFDIDASELPGIADLAWGSFPCQDLSLAGNGQGLDGERSGAFWGFWRLIRQMKARGRKPKMIVLENVFGTLTSHAGADFEQIANAVGREGYLFGAMIIDAVHFVPQSRPRMFVVGVDTSCVVPQGLVSSRPSPAWHPDAVIRAYNRLPRSVKNSWLWWNPPAPDARVATMDDVIESEPVGVAWNSSAQTNNLLLMMTPVNRRKVIEAQRSGAVKVGTIYKRTRGGFQRAEVRFDGVAGCLRTPAGGSSRQTIIVVDGPSVRSRLISPREAARLMGLPETYCLPSKYNNAYHLLGDGVVVPVVRHLRERILDPIIAANAQAQLVFSA